MAEPSTFPTSARQAGREGSMEDYDGRAHLVLAAAVIIIMDL